QVQPCISCRRHPAFKFFLRAGLAAHRQIVRLARRDVEWVAMEAERQPDQEPVVRLLPQLPADRTAHGMHIARIAAHMFASVIWLEISFSRTVFPSAASW